MKTLTGILFAVAILFACSSDKKEESTTDTTPATTPQEQVQQTPPPANQTPPGQVNVPAGEDGKVYHYVCEQGHEGGYSDVSGPCPVCGKQMAHNQAFHNQTNNNANQPTINLNQENPPAQNAKGEYHYTCPNGHPGSATGGTCAECGATLVHNQAYHQ